jgi:hypothetical protein
MTLDEKRIRKSLKDDFEYYAPQRLKTRTKSGAIQPMWLNVAQLYPHAKFDAQRKHTGRICALILKGRQQGCSTYVEDRRDATASTVGRTSKRSWGMTA